jgi:hypothetical protein
MRIRSTRPNFWRSGRIASVSWDARLVLKGLESYVDDNGAGKNDIALIVGDLFQRDLIREPSRTVARVSEAISELSQAGLLWLYDDDGTDLLYIAFWDECQRVDKPQAGRFRRPDGTSEYKSSVIRESSKTPREPSRTVAPVVGEQGSSGVVEKKTCATSSRSCPPRFDEFWTAYPRRRDRRKAEKAFANALNRADVDTIIAGAARYASDPNRADQFTKYAEGWLNGDCWLDEPLPSRNGSAPVHKLRSVAELAQRARAAEDAAQLTAANQLKELG